MLEAAPVGVHCCARSVDLALDAVSSVGDMAKLQSMEPPVPPNQNSPAQAGGRTPAPAVNRRRTPDISPPNKNSAQGELDSEDEGGFGIPSAKFSLEEKGQQRKLTLDEDCLLYTSPSPRD
eukprot:9755619-Alexandrium_andersonii.AAC.1